MGTESRVALIVGITGSLGSEVGAALLAQGWQCARSIGIRTRLVTPYEARQIFAGLPATRCCSTRGGGGCGCGRTDHRSCRKSAQLS